ncbi:MAG: glycosyltransferase [Planctomycetaceae bacterium]|jgi:glycosyltransferase involved in cell wall biosynthesis|nr:glycosyltransferase [Planctomycetaceae bacterium]
MTSRISIIIPVYNEAENIATVLHGIEESLQNEPHEILIVYDFDEDSTLVAIEQMQEKPEQLRLIKNESGGVANALKVGFYSAKGDVIVTVMADCSDDPADIPAMVQKCRDGASVVAGSRYVRGGRQIGGQFLKRFLSRAASLSLYWIAGLNTHDVTNNFRAYRADFIRSVEIESNKGFEIATELTVKAHNNGKQIDEVPTTWRDRTAGTSRFKLRQWLPEYLRWYWAAMLVPICVWAISFCLYYEGAQWIREHTFPIPVLDAGANVTRVVGEEPITLEWLWSQYSEHRLPLPRLWYLAVAIPTHARETYICIANTLWMFLATLVCLWGLRRIRGRHDWSDLFVSFLLLTPTLCDENWCRGWNGCNTIPTSLLLIAGTLLVTWSNKPSFIRVGSLALAIMALPLCGIGHVVTGSCLALVSIVPAIKLFKSADFKDRFKSAVLFCGIIATLTLSILYFVGYEIPAERPESQGILAALAGAFYLYCSALIGPLFKINIITITCALLMLFLLVSGIFLLVKDFYCNYKSRFETFLIMSVLLVSGLLIGTIGWGRNGGGFLNISAPRLVSFAIPAQVFLYIIFTRHSVSILRYAMIGVLAFGIIASYNASVSNDFFYVRKNMVDDIWNYRLAETLVNKQCNGEKLLSLNEMELVIKNRLGVLRVTDPMYVFDELKLIKRIEPPTASDVRLYNIDRNSVIKNTASGGLRFKCSMESVMLNIDNIPVPENHTVVTKVVIEAVESQKIYPVYFYRTRKTTRPIVTKNILSDYSMDLALPILEPLVDIQYHWKPKKQRGETPEEQRKFFLRGTRCFDFDIPLPGEFIIHSVECRAMPIVPTDK